MNMFSMLPIQNIYSDSRHKISYSRNHIIDINNDLRSRLAGTEIAVPGSSQSTIPHAHIDRLGQQYIPHTSLDLIRTQYISQKRQ